MEQLQTFLSEFWGWIAMGAFGLTTLIEVTPIKINPWSKLFKFIGSQINGEMMEMVKDLSSKVEEQGARIDDNERDRIRYEILDFANSCRNKRRHSIDEFEHIFEINDKYHEILERRKEKNGRIDRDMKYIQELYIKNQENDDFL